MKDYNNYYCCHYYHHTVITLTLRDEKLHGTGVVQRLPYRHNKEITRSILTLLSPSLLGPTFTEYNAWNPWDQGYLLSVPDSIYSGIVNPEKALNSQSPIFLIYKILLLSILCSHRSYSYLCYQNWDVSVAVLNSLNLLTRFIFTKLLSVFPISPSLLSFSLLSLSSVP